WRAARAAALSASVALGDFRFGGNLLPPLLLPRRQDRLDRGRDARQPANDEAAPARGRGVFPFPARAPGDGALKRLIVTADDFGIAPEVNEAVEQAHRNGILSAASLMVTGRACADAVARARRNPKLRVGLHLVLTDGAPALSPERIPDLLDASGALRTDMVSAGIDIFLWPRVRRQVRAEIAAQLAAYRATGLALDHVNSHHHFHLHPTIAAEVIRAGSANGMRGIRLPL